MMKTDLIKSKKLKKNIKMQAADHYVGIKLMLV